MYDTQREYDVDEALLKPKRTFEGTYCIKSFKNDNGKDYPFTVDCESESEAKEILKRHLDECMKEQGFYGWKINQITERK